MTTRVSRLDNFRCYLVHNKDNLWFAKNSDYKVIVRLCGNSDSFLLGKNLVLSGKVENETIYPESCQVLGIPKLELNHWRMYSMSSPKVIHCPSVQPPLSQLRLDFDLPKKPTNEFPVFIKYGTEWSSNSRVIKVTGMKIDDKDIFNSQVIYALVHGNKRSRLSLRTLIFDYRITNG